MIGGAVLIALGASPTADAGASEDVAATATYATTGMVAIHRTRRHATAPAVERARVELSAHGRRITELGPGAVQRILVNADEARIWLVDRGRRIVHEVPLVRRASTPVRPVPGPVIPDHARAGAPGAQVFSTVQCEGLHATRRRSGTWRGRTVRTATCREPLGRIASIQDFDEVAGIVVRVRHRAGHIDELHGIRRFDFAENHFRPAASLRSVDIDELVGEPAAVATYAEP